MELSRRELLVIAALVRLPRVPWKHIESECGSKPATARATRDALLAVRAIYTVPHVYTDTLDRVRKMLIYDINPRIPHLAEIRAWVEAGQSYPLEFLKPQATPRLPLQRPPGAMHNPEEHVLEVIMRNPNAPWRRIRPLIRLRGPEADRARDNLIDSKDVECNAGHRINKRGVPYSHRILIPNEEKPLVKELRKRYGIPVAETTIPREELLLGGLLPGSTGSVKLGEAITNDLDLAATLRHVLSKRG